MQSVAGDGDLGGEVHSEEWRRDAREARKSTSSIYIYYYGYLLFS